MFKCAGIKTVVNFLILCNYLANRLISRKLIVKKAKIQIIEWTYTLVYVNVRIYMIVIRGDKENSGKNKRMKSFLPLIGTLVIFVLLFILIPVGLTFLFNLPWYLSFIYPFGIIVGAVLIILGILIAYRGIKDLRLKYSYAGYQKGDVLVTTGIYAYTRNPMYFGAAIMIFGWFLVFPFTFILISAVLFTILFCITAKSEEKQLSQKFGKEYLKYKRNVPFFVPYRKFR